MDTLFKIWIVLLLANFGRIGDLTENAQLTDSKMQYYHLNTNCMKVESVPHTNNDKFVQVLQVVLELCLSVMFINNGWKFETRYMPTTFRDFETKKFIIDEDFSKYFLLTKFSYDRKFKGDLQDNIFRFQQTLRQNIQVFPASLGKYLKERENTSEKASLMKYEWARYESFKMFPMDSPAMPLRLASNGFYYDGHGDKVTCFLCGVQYGNWKPYDIVEDVHARISPRCDIVRGHKSSNIGIHSDNARGAEGGIERPLDGTDAASSDVTHVHRQSRCQENRASFLRNKQPHKHPEFESYQRRIDTFSGWPIPDIVEPCVLADAGFFFVGAGDCVRCFSCGGGLRSLEYGDGPWSEHALWFPNCRFLIERKGEAFIRENNAEYIGLQPEQDAEITPNNHIQEMEPVDAIYKKTDNSAEDDHELIKTEQVKRLNAKKSDILTQLTDIFFEMGFMKSDVKIILQQTEFQGITQLTEATYTMVLDQLIKLSTVSEETKSHNSAEIPTSTSTIEQKECTENDNTGNAAHSNIEHVSISSTDSTPDPKVLLQENLKMKDKLTCKICMERDSNIVFTPCGHMVSCGACSARLRKCAMCRKVIKGRVKTYLG